MNRVHSARPRLVLASLLALVATAARADLRTVSPGELDREVEIASACPTFSWGEASVGVAEARGSELAVFALDESDRPELVLRRQLDAAATSWTPARAECLAAGGRYVWSIRALAAPVGASEWSAPRRFVVPGAPSEEEVANALELLRRWRERDGGSSRASRNPRSASSSTAIAPRGLAPLGGGPAAAVSGTFVGLNGVGVSGVATSTGGPATGVRGETASSSGYGILGISTATENGPIAIRGEISATTGHAISGYSSSTGGYANGVLGETQGTGGAGVRGSALTTTSPYAFGVAGSSVAQNSAGVHGGTNAQSALGVWGTSGASDSGVGVGASATGTGGMGFDAYVSASTGSTRGLRAWVNSTQGIGVLAYLPTTTGSATGVLGDVDGPTGTGVYGNIGATSGVNYGVRGVTASTQGRGVYGNAPNTTGAYAGYFQGRVNVTGTLSKGGGSFRIDHPLEPEAKYLYHSFVESPDMMNVYNGNVRLDEQGEAWVALPDWFEALNRDFRYQLTPIGQPSMVWVGARVEKNRFLVRGGPGIEVSWQVTGIRQDRWAEAHRIPVEEVKPEGEQGTYLHPEEWGLQADRGLDWKVEKPLRQAAETLRLEREAEGDRPAWARILDLESLEVEHGPR